MSVPPMDGSARVQAESPFKTARGLRRMWLALLNSLAGLWAALQVESAFRQELALAAVLVPLACWLPLRPLERAVLVAAVLLVLIVELLNSSVEAAIDRISFEHHRLSKRAKDFGSAAVLLALVLCAIVWGLIAGPLLGRLLAML